MSNLNLECFQLSFDIHIVHVGQKLGIFKNCSTESKEISAVKVGYFSATLQQRYATWDGVQRHWSQFLLTSCSNCSRMGTPTSDKRNIFSTECLDDSRPIAVGLVTVA